MSTIRRLHLKVRSENGFYDSVTPFAQTQHDLAAMPLDAASVRRNLTIRNYASGHMIYLDHASRHAMKEDLAPFYASAVADHAARARILALKERTPSPG